MTRLKMGDPVVYRPDYGHDNPVVAYITGLSITEEPRDKYGDDVESVSVDVVVDNRCCFCLDDGHWAYSDQIDLSMTQTLHEALRLPVDRLPEMLGRGIDFWIESRLQSFKG